MKVKTGNEAIITFVSNSLWLQIIKVATDLEGLLAKEKLELSDFDIIKKSILWVYSTNEELEWNVVVWEFNKKNTIKEINLTVYINTKSFHETIDVNVKLLNDFINKLNTSKIISAYIYKELKDIIPKNGTLKYLILEFLNKHPNQWFSANIFSEKWTIAPFIWFNANARLSELNTLGFVEVASKETNTRWNVQHVWRITEKWKNIFK